MVHDSPNPVPGQSVPPLAGSFMPNGPTLGCGKESAAGGALWRAVIAGNFTKFGTVGGRWDG